MGTRRMEGRVDDWVRSEPHILLFLYQGSEESKRNKAGPAKRSDGTALPPLNPLDHAKHQSKQIATPPTLTTCVDSDWWSYTNGVSAAVCTTTLDWAFFYSSPLARIPCKSELDDSGVASNPDVNLHLRLNRGS
jgi:hypothetical protein